MDYLKLTDNGLLELLRNGDQVAFTTIYGRHCAPLYRTALRMLGDPDVAKDVVQEVFIALFERSKNSVIGNLQAYLFQAAKYQCFMHLRSGRISEKHLSRLGAVMISNELEEQLDVQELEKLLNKSMAGLPEKCREVFYLSRFESLSNKKIAERLNISHKTVENQITKALKVLHMSVDKLIAVVLFIASN